MFSSVKESIFGIKTVLPDISIYLEVAKEELWDHIHCGYWKTGAEDFVTAQNNLYTFVKFFIPSRVKNILDVGGGIGGVSNLLIQDGYNPLCVVPDKHLIEYGTKCHPRVKFLRGTAEFFSDKCKYDLALLIESYRYFTHHPRAIANISKQLKDNGWIIILDDFALAPDRFPQEQELIKILNGQNYFLTQKIDISSHILPTCEYLENYFKNKIETMSYQWAQSKKKYLNKENNYLLLVFKRTHCAS